MCESKKKSIDLVTAGWNTVCLSLDLVDGTLRRPLVKDRELFANDCYGSQVPCGHCQWSLGGIRCL